MHDEVAQLFQELGYERQRYAKAMLAILEADRVAERLLLKATADEPIDEASIQIVRSYRRARQLLTRTTDETKATK